MVDQSIQAAVRVQTQLSALNKSPDRGKYHNMKDHVQIKLKEINLDLQTVNTSRIQLVKTDSNKAGSFSIASSGNLKNPQSPDRAVLNNQIINQ